MGFIHQPEASRIGNDGLADRFGHHRLIHSFHVAALMALLLANNRQAFNENDALHGLLAALLHDVRTPAGGDTIKLLDRRAFDEDANFGQLFKKARWQEVAARYGLDNAQLLAIVQETCLLGQLKDVADKIAYVVLDAFMMLSVIHYANADGSCSSYDAVRAQIAAHPFVGDVWEDVRIINGQVVFTDARRLAALLKLRALLFRDLYHNPETRYPQFIYVNCILRRLYETGQITTKRLLEGDDYDIIQLLSAQLGMPWWQLSMEGLGRIHTQRYASPRQAERAMRHKRLNGGLVLLEDLSRPINSGTSFLVLNSRGQVQPLKRALPGAAAEIDDICRQACQAIVYHLPNPHWRLARVLQRGPHP